MNRASDGSAKKVPSSESRSRAGGAPEWSRLYAARRQMRDRFGSIWRLRVRSKCRHVFRDALKSARSVLDVGAGRRRLEKRVAEWYPDILYCSMDIDRSTHQDYYRLEDVDRTFDVVVGFEVIEHLTVDEACHLLADMHRILNAGGWLVISTPNTYYPPAFLRDSTHRTPFCYDELGALVTLAGFEVHELVRIYNHPFHRKLAHQWLFGWLHRFMGIDFAKQIVLVARKPTPGTQHLRLR
jgi:2-polyprenyl-3-methyl-5-hydroxy-6-metoxy-1,4-benzoquinol methylase